MGYMQVCMPCCIPILSPIFASSPEDGEEKSRGKLCDTGGNLSSISLKSVLKRIM